MRYCHSASPFQHALLCWNCVSWKQRRDWLMPEKLATDRAKKRKSKKLFRGNYQKKMKSTKEGGGKKLVTLQGRRIIMVLDCFCKFPHSNSFCIFFCWIWFELSKKILVIIDKIKKLPLWTKVKLTIEGEKIPFQVWYMRKKGYRIQQLSSIGKYLWSVLTVKRFFSIFKVQSCFINIYLIFCQ